MNVELPKTPGDEDRERANLAFQLVLGAAIIIINLVMLYVIAQIEIPTRNDAAFNIYLGNVMGWMSALVVFAFPGTIGALRDAATRNRLASALQEQVRKAPPPTPEAVEALSEANIDVPATGTDEGPGQDPGRPGSADGSTDPADSAPSGSSTTADPAPTNTDAAPSNRPIGQGLGARPG